MNNQELVVDKKEFKIFGYTIWRILAYFIIYSFLGFVIETIFGLLTKGVIESRKSMLYGPFCCIYGLGAVFLICIPEKWKEKKWKLVVAGVIIGSLVEYIISWVGEVMFHVRWWDYSNYPLNINGRICLLYSLFWGILTLFLNNLINPEIDKIINKFPIKQSKAVVLVLIIFLALDMIVSSFALKMFYTRVIYEYKVDVVGVEDYYEKYLNIYKNDRFIRRLVLKLFKDEKMIKTYPNLKIKTKNGILFIRDFFPDIKPYYFKVFTPTKSINKEAVTF